MNRKPQILGRAAALLATVAAFTLGGCGLKGPLYLPAPAAAATASQPSPAPSPAP